jgi:hypothetical protein
MEPSTHLSTETAGQRAAGMRQPRRDTAVIDSVKVAPETFDSLIFLGSEEKKEYVEGQNIPRDQKHQQLDKATGLPLWSVKLYVTTWRGLERQVKVNVPAAEDPAERFAKGELVALWDAEAGVTPKREGNGYTIWMKAARIDVAADRKPVAVGAVA